MDRDEARRRFERACILAGYGTHWKWADEGEGIHSSVIRSGLRTFRGFRAVLWPYKQWWEGMLSFRVSAKGEFPLTGGKVVRERILNLQAFSLVLPKLQHIEPTLYRWEKTFDTDAVALCVNQLSIELIKRGAPNKAKTLLHAMTHGDLGASTIGESLAMVQERWFTRREDRLLSARVWWRTLEPRINLEG